MRAAEQQVKTVPDPWDTRAFRQARLCMFLLILIVVTTDTRKPSDIGILLMVCVPYIFFDTVRICLWKAGHYTALDKWRNAGEERRRQYRGFLMDIASMGVGFLTVLILVTWQARHLEHGMLSHLRFAAELVLANLCGWNLMIWRREAKSAWDQYHAKRQRVARVTEPAQVASAPVYGRAVQPDAPATLRVGKR